MSITFCDFNENISELTQNKQKNKELNLNQLRF